MPPVVTAAAAQHNSKKPHDPQRRRSSGTNGSLLPILLDQSDDAVKQLAAVAILDSMASKLDCNATWQKRRLIVTTDRLSILLSRSKVHEKFEVADYILMKEILNVCRMEIDTTPRAGGSATRPRNMSSPTSLLSAVTSASLALTLKASEVEDRRISMPAGFSANAVSNWEQIVNGTEKDSTFEIRTFPDGLYQGKIFYFCTGNEESCARWVTCLLESAHNARRAFERKHRVERLQSQVQAVYKSLPFQGFVAFLLVSNFIVTIAQNQILASDAYISHIYDSIDLAFTIVFVAELAFNFASNAVRPFCIDPWNWFDTVVVFASVILIPMSGNNGVVKMLRVFRVFRVIRVFGRFGQFRQIVNAIIASILPGAQALLIGLVVVAIYATIGIQYFAGADQQDFGDFFHAFYTLFSVVAYARWPEDKLSPFYDDGSLNVGVLVFIYSYVILVIFVLLQVVVAVILDNFYKASAREKEEDAAEAASKAGHSFAMGCPLDPLLESISSQFDTNDDLNERLVQIFHAFDTDGTGRLSFSEISEGLFRLDPTAKERLNLEEYHKITESGKLCDLDGELECEQFKVVMQRELKKFTQRKAADALYCIGDSPEKSSLLTSLKMTMIELSQAHDVLAQHEEKIDSIVRHSELIIKQQEEKFDRVMQSVFEAKALLALPKEISVELEAVNFDTRSKLPAERSQVRSRFANRDSAA